MPRDKLFSLGTSKNMSLSCCSGGIGRNQFSSKLPCKMETLVPLQELTAGRIPWLVDAQPSSVLCSWQHCQPGAEPPLSCRQVVPEPVGNGMCDVGICWDHPGQELPMFVQSLGREW